MNEENNNFDNNNLDKDRTKKTILRFIIFLGISICICVLLFIILVFSVNLLSIGVKNRNYDYIDFDLYLEDYGPKNCKKDNSKVDLSKTNIIITEYNMKVIEHNNNYKIYYKDTLYDLGISSKNNKISPVYGVDYMNSDVLIGLSTKDGYFDINKCKYYFKGYTGFDAIHSKNFVFIGKDKKSIVFGDTSYGEKILLQDNLEEEIGKITEISGKFLHKDDSYGFAEIEVKSEGSSDGLETHKYIYYVDRSKAERVLDNADDAQYYVRNNNIYILNNKKFYNYNSTVGKSNEFDCDYFFRTIYENYVVIYSNKKLLLLYEDKVFATIKDNIDIDTDKVKSSDTILDLRNGKVKFTYNDGEEHLFIADINKKGN